VLKCLAIGGFSKVYLVRSLKDGQFYAMKVMLKQFILENEKASIIENEKQISAMMSHPFVVRLNHCFETPRFVCFVLDCTHPSTQIAQAVNFSFCSVPVNACRSSTLDSTL
jgi:serum/glucocorticoid-regulated kinase 2